MKDFVHLHLHSEYSLLDSYVKISDISNSLIDMGMDRIAITDKGNLFASVKFYNSMKKAGIKPIIGAQVSVGGDPVLCYCRGAKGYINLVKLVSEGYENSEVSPFVDEEYFFDHSDGLVAIIGLQGSNLYSLIKRGLYERAKSYLEKYKKHFSKESLYIQISRGLNSDDDKVYYKKIKLSESVNIPLVATNEVYYLNRTDAPYRDVLKCIGDGVKRSDKSREKLPSDNYYLKSPKEMNDIFYDLPSALENTAKISEICQFEFDFTRHYLPKFDLPEGVEASDYLRELCLEGLKFRYGENALTYRKDALDRLNYELDTIKGMGFDDYFLICADFVNYAKSNGILVGPGRGSGGGSLACYALNITDIDPLKYNLIFERFLNPQRISMPDLDIDFQDDRRAEVIDYVTEKYGRNRVSQIISFGTLSARAVIRDVGRVLGLPLANVDAMAKAIPSQLDVTLDYAIKNSNEFKRICNSSSLNREVFEVARRLEGLPRHTSTHAAGVVISKTEMTDIVPTIVKGPQTCTQYDMEVLEKLGLLKMDFLGLRYLSLISNTIEMIKETRRVDFSLGDIDYNDQKTYNLLSSANTLGVFQLESSGMLRFLTALKPRCLEDIIVGISLYRPGPMESIPLFIENRNSPSKTKYLHPLLKPILEPTSGCIVYQEQVMQIVRDLAGFSYARSDMIRRAMSKKKLDIMQRERHNFIYGIPEEGVSGALANGVPEDICVKIYDDMVEFAKYAFNKSHAAAYAVIAYQTAYLKANYTLEYMASLLTSVSGSQKSVAKYVGDANKMGIHVLAPSVTKSKGRFTVEGNSIRFGLSAIKHIGSKLIKDIESLQGSEFPDALMDFYRAIDRNSINKKSAEALILSGAMDCFEFNAATMVENFEKMFDIAHPYGRWHSESQLSLIDMGGGENLQPELDIIMLEEYDDTYLERSKLELMGGLDLFYASSKNHDSVYIRMESFDSEEKKYIEGLSKSSDGYKLYVFDANENKTRRYTDRIYFDHYTESILVRRYGRENVVVK